jgi:UDP-glucose 4-epimerase
MSNQNLAMERPSRIVITGIAGFIGSNLAQVVLGRGYEVIGIDNLAYGLREQVPAGAGFFKLDIRDGRLLELLRPGDVVFHLAAKNCINDCQADPVETASINVMGTVNVFEAARRAGAAKVIYAESSALYEGASRRPTAETAVAPRSFYAVSKLAGMAFAKAYRRYHGMRTTALRYFCVYGPGQDYRRAIAPVMSAFIIGLMRGQQPVIFGSGSKRRDFIHVDDVNAFHLLCLADRRTDGRVFNLGSGINHSINDIYQKIAGLLGSSTVPRYLDDLPGEAQETLADISAARALGWQPKVTLERGLASFIEYYRARGVPELAPNRRSLGNLDWQ